MSAIVDASCSRLDGRECDFSCDADVASVLLELGGVLSIA